ncbi:VanW like protein [Abditibacterium utsteinense]|uniref:VanW like protein n=1 Tax=Abditibacterium utsteinense TaxID=1960156 RepID=A0A2S8SPA3_9BACT|nr:VanW family protein [Abditibacterium utsteinense]PQV62621.1 VanW like protein [Abditibacterium utsteinense]
MKTSSLLILPFLISGVASAQNLPAPAPQPAPSKVKVAPAPEPFMLDDPQPSDSPIIIGEPVRKQSGAPAKMPSKVAPKPNASVAGVSVVGLSDAQAVAKMRAALAPQLKEPVRLVIGDYQYTFLREELGASLPLWPLMRQARAKNGDAPLRLQIDEAKLRAALEELDAQVRVDFERTGLNIPTSAARLKIALEATPIPSSIALVTLPLKVPTAKSEKSVEAAVKAASAKSEKAEKASSGRYAYLLASFSTRYDASLRGRTTNLRMAAKNIDGTVVAAGKTFSTNLAIGPRNAAAGWREAKMFVSGQVVSGTGAGICQAASTLYNAALLGNFPIIERHAHSMRVMYVPPSRDAALMWGSKDFKFRNTSGGAIRVQTLVAGGQFHVKLWGEKPNEKAPVRIVTRVLSRTGGTKSEAFKIVGDQKIRLSRDSYKPHP